jgi:hypothetical protein
MHWKANNESFILVLVLTSEGLWITLCDHDKMLHHQFWAVTVLVSCWALSSCCGRPLVAPTPSLILFCINSIHYYRTLLQKPSSIFDICPGLYYDSVRNAKPVGYLLNELDYFGNSGGHH